MYGEALEEAVRASAIEDKALRQRQTEEAARRLEALEEMGMHEDVLTEWEDGMTLFYSERMSDPLFEIFGFEGPIGGLFWVDQDATSAKIKDAVERFERETGALVYHATHEFTSFGEILDLFFVSTEPDEWPGEIAELKAGWPYVRAVNLDDEAMSDYGCIGFKVSGGGLVRTA